MKTYTVTLDGKAMQLGALQLLSAAQKQANGRDDAAPDFRPEGDNLNELPAGARETGFLGDGRVRTPEGDRMISELSAGSVVLGHDGQPATIRHMLVAPMTKQGVLVRAPYFGLNQDLVIGADHRVAVTSDLAEYLFGAETVLVPAWAIKDNRRATHWELAPKAKLFQLQLDRATGVMVGNCRLEGTAMCRSAIGKVLNDDEARCFAAEHKMGYQN